MRLDRARRRPGLIVMANVCSIKQRSEMLSFQVNLTDLVKLLPETEQEILIVAFLPANARIHSTVFNG
jgi:hypothetical protein